MHRAPGKGKGDRLKTQFSPFGSFTDTGFLVPCGQCIGCRLERSRQWALRCMHESTLHENNLFLTLTYNDENLPLYNSLNLRHTQLFLKKLRFKFGSGIRFYLAGEYGEQTARPHYHAIMFNFSLPDLKFYAKGKDDHRIFTSKTLDELWGHGECKVGSVTFQSAAYVARYITKKITGKKAAAHYGNRKPEFATMSRRPGIGAGWYEKYPHETYPSDLVVHEGVSIRPPKAYDKRLELENPKLYAAVRVARVQNAKQHADDQTRDRLKVREEVKLAQVTQLKRTL